MPRPKDGRVLVFKPAPQSTTEPNGVPQSNKENHGVPQNHTETGRTPQPDRVPQSTIEPHGVSQSPTQSGGTTQSRTQPHRVPQSTTESDKVPPQSLTEFSRNQQPHKVPQSTTEAHKLPQKPAEGPQSPTRPRRDSVCRKESQASTEPHTEPLSPTGASGDDAIAGSGMNAAKVMKAAPQESFFLIGGKFNLGRKIGAGSFGEVYIGNNAQTGEELAIKTESVKTKTPQLVYEAKLYNILKGGVGIPTVHWSGVEGDNNIMVMDLMGSSLEDLFASCNRKFSVKTAVMIATQMVNLLEYVHSKSLIHRDVKPDNFLMGTGKNSNQVYVIDFGLAKKYRDSKTKQHVPYREGKQLTGTARYTSINTHLGIEQSRRDDLEAVGHILLYFVKGSLPWQGIQAGAPKEKNEKIMQCKQSTPVDSLCQGFPGEFATFLNHCRNLRFEDAPDYPYLLKLFKDVMSRQGYKYDSIFDWSSSNGPSTKSSEQDTRRGKRRV